MPRAGTKNPVIKHTKVVKGLLGVRRLFKILNHDHIVTLEVREERDADDKILYDADSEEIKDANRKIIDDRLEDRLSENRRGINEIKRKKKLRKLGKEEEEIYLEPCHENDLPRFKQELIAEATAKRKNFKKYPPYLTYVEGSFLFLFKKENYRHSYQVQVRRISDNKVKEIKGWLEDAQEKWDIYWKERAKFDNSQEDGAVLTPEQQPQDKEAKHGKKNMSVMEDCKTRIREASRIVSNFEKSVYVVLLGAEKPTLKLMNDFLLAFHKEGLHGSKEEKNWLRKEFKEQINYVCEKQKWQLYCVPLRGGKAEPGRLNLAANGKSGNRFLVQPIGAVTSDNPNLWLSVKPPKLSVRLA